MDRLRQSSPLIQQAFTPKHVSLTPFSQHLITDYKFPGRNSGWRTYRGTCVLTCEIGQSNFLSVAGPVPGGSVLKGVYVEEIAPSGRTMFVQIGETQYDLDSANRGWLGLALPVGGAQTTVELSLNDSAVTEAKARVDIWYETFGRPGVAFMPED